MSGYVQHPRNIPQLTKSQGRRNRIPIRHLQKYSTVPCLYTDIFFHNVSYFIVYIQGQISCTTHQSKRNCLLFLLLTCEFNFPTDKVIYVTSGILLSCGHACITCIVLISYNTSPSVIIVFSLAIMRKELQESLFILILL